MPTPELPPKTSAPPETPVKNAPFRRRFACAVFGLRAGLGEASFRFQLLAAALVLVFLLVARPPLLWTALMLLMVGLVLAAELFNTALEAALDGLHPQWAPFVRIAKDCAAGAVLVLSLTAIAVFVLMVLAVYY
jgi:undecaprenol kinase